MHYLSNSFALALCFVFLCLLPHTRGQTLYWDTNGTTAGASGGTSTEGFWVESMAFWTTSIDGTGSTTVWTPGASAVFSAGSNATGTSGVSVSGTQDVSQITFEEGEVSLGGGSLSNLETVLVDSSAIAIINSQIMTTMGLTKACSFSRGAMPIQGGRQSRTAHSGSGEQMRPSPVMF